ncbi:MAG: DNA-directed RNA polymerase subunit beta' [Parcubacteria group bacterium]|nr:DNA-directed RNA polymerase subunit beta' [Parcubacteria group bacterium]
MPHVNFQSIRLKLASPEKILEWSHGEVTKPETINYRTQKPERDGLFDERIFGPTKDWQCYCGKYKRIRYKGIVCDKCGVEVTRSIVRRERMGHIKLAVPVAHIWFFRGMPNSRLGLVMNLSVQDLERVIYFAGYIIIRVDKVAREAAVKQLASEYAEKQEALKASVEENRRAIREARAKALAHAAGDEAKTKIAADSEGAEVRLGDHYQEGLKHLAEAYAKARAEIESIKKKKIISEGEYRELSLKYGQIFEAGIGAEALRRLAEEINVEKLAERLAARLSSAEGARRRKIIQRLRLLRSMLRAGIRPEWMLFTHVPVIPPDLRPMVQLDGGRFAASDLNDLYRRVINRNNRLKKLMQIGAPEVITRNEKRMLQEAVDALFDNSARRGKEAVASTGQKRKLKSLADMLKGKQGRFRQNLLGKRVDYSGRSVIVSGPHLRIYQCGLPKEMALELFKPFVIHKLIAGEHAHNVRSASKLIESATSVVWDALDEVIKGRYVLLNRAPTLHRLGIQAFEPILIEGKAIQLHPLVTTAFNADFDGDQMAVHLPLTGAAVMEARDIMLSSLNLLKPATGDPIATPDKDLVLGVYYLTRLKPGAKGEGKAFSSVEETLLAYDYGELEPQAKIKVLIDGTILETSAGRLIVNRIIPPELGFQNTMFDKKGLQGLVAKSLERLGLRRTAEFLDAIKNLGFSAVQKSGISWGMNDLKLPEAKKRITEEAQARVAEVAEQYEAGLLTDEERYNRVIEIWTEVKNKITEEVKKTLDPFGSVFSMIDSGARASWGQVTQMAGMKGLVANPVGKTIELPVISSFKEGFSILEYFISTHGARKGMSDTALRTADAGYLTRRLVDVAQDVVIYEEDCKDTEGIAMLESEARIIGRTLAKLIAGRILARDVEGKNGERIAARGELVTNELAQKIEAAEVPTVYVRSVLTCRALRGACRQCYGVDLATHALVKIGEAVGIVAAQAIGEPGTQLTLRTFHTGGVAGQDITQGLPRVEELFEARDPKGEATLAQSRGRVTVQHDESTGQYAVTIQGEKEDREVFALPKRKRDLLVRAGDRVVIGQPLMMRDGEIVAATKPGRAVVQKSELLISMMEVEPEAYTFSSDVKLTVHDGDRVTPGTPLTEGSLNLRELLRLSGRGEVERYIVREIQKIYSAQGQTINHKHIEIIVRQMFSKRRVVHPRDTNFLEGEIIDVASLNRENTRVTAQGKRPATSEVLLMGITKASLTTDSFLAAASFQETARVLIDAAIRGKTDPLAGLKENVIIGRIIPAGTGLHEYQTALSADAESAP